MIYSNDKLIKGCELQQNQPQRTLCSFQKIIKRDMIQIFILWIFETLFCWIKDRPNTGSEWVPIIKSYISAASNAWRLDRKIFPIPNIIPVLFRGEIFQYWAVTCTLFSASMLLVPLLTDYIKIHNIFHQSWAFLSEYMIFRSTKFC